MTLRNQIIVIFVPATEIGWLAFLDIQMENLGKRGSVEVFLPINC